MFMPKMPKSRTEKELEELRAMMQGMQKQIDSLVDRIAGLRTPPRENWIRKTKPAWEMETLTLPAARVSRKLELIKPQKIAHVHLCMSGNEQYITSYDSNWQTLPEYCGRFKEVGLKVLEAAGNLEWEVVAESA